MGSGGVATDAVDVLVVGGGPAGSATAYWLARAGHHVTIVEKKRFPREKTCGDGLTPRAVYQLEEMGLAGELEKYHRYDGLRAVAGTRSIELRWPEHERYPRYGYVVRRCDLDQFVAENAVAAGATLLTGCAATEPLFEGGRLVGAVVEHQGTDEVAPRTEEIRARYVVVADGANSRIGRALGTTRNRTLPQGMAIRGYYESPLHAEPWIESSLDVRDRAGNSMPGYGWIFPVGNGTINVGIGLLSTFRDYKSVNTSHLMAEWAATLPGYWEIDPGSPIAPPTGGRLPMGGSVGPKVGPTWIAVGDAAGSVNPFNGEGIDYAYETGRMAAGLLDECLTTNNAMALQRYPRLLDDEYGRYFKVARLFARVIGQPVLMRQLVGIGMRSETLMDWVLRIMANLMREADRGAPEFFYSAAAALAGVIPEHK